MAARRYEISIRNFSSSVEKYFTIFACEDIKFSREGSPGISLVFI